MTNDDQEISDDTHPTKAGPAKRPRRTFDQVQASDFLEKECDTRAAPATLQKKRSVGGGPEYYRGFGGRCYYTEEALRAWAALQRSKQVASTSELPPRARRAETDPPNSRHASTEHATEQVDEIAGVTPDGNDQTCSRSTVNERVRHGE